MGNCIEKRRNKLKEEEEEKKSYNVESMSPLNISDNSGQQEWISMMHALAAQQSKEFDKDSIKLDPMSEEYKCISEFYHQGWTLIELKESNKSSNSLFATKHPYPIVDIFRVYDKKTFDAFDECKRKISNRNQVFLWHGSDASYETIIENGGLSTKYSSSNNRLGRGIYGSLHSSYSAKNFTVGGRKSPQKESKDYKTIFLCQFLVGNSEKKLDGFSSPSDKGVPVGYHSRMFDRGDNRNFAVFNDAQVRITHVVRLLR
jgi:hypothetical protein